MKQHELFMGQALEQARRALEQGEFPVGCVMVAGERVVAGGGRVNSDGSFMNEMDHAEVVTLRDLLSRQPDIDCGAITVYSTMEPCLMCYATMLLSGIRHFVWAYEDVMGGGTNVELTRLNPLYAEMKTELVPGVLRMESLALFQDFFKRYSYWQDSLLSRYTLAQHVAAS